jgi:hypothetical protein
MQKLFIYFQIILCSLFVSRTARPIIYGMKHLSEKGPKHKFDILECLWQNTSCKAHLFCNNQLKNGKKVGVNFP